MRGVSDEAVCVVATLVVLHLLLLRACPPARRSTVAPPRPASVPPRRTSAQRAVSARQAGLAYAPPAWSQAVSAASGKSLVVADENGNIHRVPLSAFLSDVQAQAAKLSDAVDAGVAALDADAADGTASVKTFLSSFDSSANVGGDMDWQKGSWDDLRAKRPDGKMFLYRHWNRNMLHDLDTSRSDWATHSNMRTLRPTYQLSLQMTPCPSGTVEVDTEEECAQAALQLGKWVPANPKTERSHQWQVANWDRDYSKGCHATHHDQGKIHWSTGTREAMGDEQRVCKIPL